jgi:AcrR family transcriptional regulator
MPEQISTRRQPSQQRSRERHERILAAAKSLIADKGSDRVKMSEVAALAEMSIGALYQYFPDKAAIVRTLAAGYSVESRACIEQGLAAAHDIDSLQRAYEGLIDEYYAIGLADPVMRDVWSGMQADKELMALELADSRASAKLVAAAIRRARPRVNAKKAELTALLVWQLGEATMRLAVTLPRKDGDVLVATFKRMTWRELSQT